MRKCMKKALFAVCAAILLIQVGCAGTNAPSAGPSAPSASPSATKTETTAASSAPTKQEDAPAQTPVRDSIIVAMESEPPTLHPFDHKAVTASFMNKLTYSYLFEANPETLDPEMLLVKEYSNTSETEWIFTIHDNVLFHNGDKMTAQDVVASMDYAKTYPTAKDYTSFWSDVCVVDEYSFKVTTEGPFAFVLNNLCNIRVLPKGLIDADHDFHTNPIGSGPYKFVKQTLGDSIEFVKFDDYFREGHPPTIRNMLWRIIPESSSRTIALEAGEVDLVIEVDTVSLDRLKASEAIETTTVRGTRVNFLAMNGEVAPFDNQLFRKAVNSAINKEAIIAIALDGEGYVALSQTPSVFGGTNTENADDYDLDAAKQYLAQSGVDTSTLSIPCIVSTDTARRAAEVLQSNLGDLGITLTIDSMDYATYLSAIMGGNYTVAVSGYTASDYNYFTTGLFHSRSLNSANLARVNDEQIDEYIELGRTQIDESLRIDTYNKLSAYLNDLTPFAPLYESVVTRAFNKDLGGIVVGATGAIRFEDVYWIN